MKKDRVLYILNALGYKFVCADPSNNGSHYDKYSDGMHNIYVGNWYIELEDDDPYPYKDPMSSEEELIRYIGL